MGAVGVGVQADGGGGEARGGVAGDLGAFGGVFGEVAGDHQVGDGAGAAQGDDADVEFGAPADEPACGLGRVRRGQAGDGGGGVPGGVLEVGGGDAGGRGQEPAGVGGVQAVEAEQDVEVDRAAGLVFGGFAVGDAHAVGQVAAAGELVEVPFDGLLGAPPQFAGAVVPHHVGGVVVAVRAQRLAEPGIVAGVAGEAGQLAAVRADSGVAAGVAGLGLAAAVGLVGAGVQPDRAGVDGAEGGGGEGGEHGRVGGDVRGDAFAADQPGADELEGVPPVGFGAGRAGGDAAVAAGFVDHPVRHGRGREWWRGSRRWRGRCGGSRRRGGWGGCIRRRARCDPARRHSVRVEVAGGELLAVGGGAR